MPSEFVMLRLDGHLRYNLEALQAFYRRNGSLKHAKAVADLLDGGERDHMLKVPAETAAAMEVVERVREERRRREPVVGSAAADESGTRDKSLPYGAPDDLADTRFSNRSSLGWGTASYGQDPNEFLGSGTDDDNDWHGGDWMME